MLYTHTHTHTRRDLLEKFHEVSQNTVEHPQLYVQQVECEHEASVAFYQT